MAVFAIDGTFASGKGTLGKRIAAHYGMTYLDTGKLYRAVAYKAMQTNIDFTDNLALAKIAENLSDDDLSNPILKSGDVGAAASKVAIVTQVRKALFDYQRKFAMRDTGAVLDGRDIGTVICPDADVKLYVDADPKIRAQRRYEELKGYGEDTNFETVLAQLSERDTRDKNRTEAPLKPAVNAHLLDTTDLSIDAAFAAAILIIEATLQAKGT